MIDDVLQHGLSRARSEMGVQSPLAGQFAVLCLALMRTKNHLSAAAHLVPRHCAAAADVLQKAAVAGGGLTGPWGSEIAGYKQLAEGFIEYARPLSAFDQILPFTRRVPLRTKLAVVTSGATGYQVNEGAAAPVSKLSLSAPALEPSLSMALIALTNSILEHAGPAATGLLSRELAGALGTANAATFFSLVTSGSPSHPSSGTAALNILADIATLLADITLGASSKLFFALSAQNCAKLATKLQATGSYPRLSVNGGDMGGITVIATDALTTTGILLDADGVAAGDDGIGIAAAESATLEMTTTPNAAVFSGSSPSTPVAAQTVSMFQTDSTALRATRFIGAYRFRAAASTLTSIAW